MRQLDMTYELWPPHASPKTNEFTKPSIELTFDLEIPLEIWARHHDNEDELVEWAIKYLFKTRITEIRKDQ